MKKNFLRALSVLMIAGAAFSCSKKKPEIPEGVLSREQMIPILADVHIAQAASELYTSGDTSEYSITDYLPYILSVHHIEKVQYDSSIAFYTRHPEILQEMYDEVINELSKKQGEETR